MTIGETNSEPNTKPPNPLNTAHKTKTPNKTNLNSVAVKYTQIGDKKSLSLQKPPKNQKSKTHIEPIPNNNSNYEST